MGKPKPRTPILRDLLSGKHTLKANVLTAQHCTKTSER